MNHLQDLTKVNLHLDPKGLAEEGVTTDTPVTIDLTEEITLRSALNLILEPLNLSFVIKNEVLNITSEQLKDGEVYQVAYNVADLVISIPNFTPNGRIGLTGALQDSLSNLRPGGVGSFSPESPLAVVASNSGANASAMIDPRVLAQLGAPGPGAMGAMGTPGPAATGSPQPMGFGPGGLGGGAIADFDSLINLITQTIQPTTWTENGGPGAVQPFFPNLSLVVSQTQEVHDEIAELLDQLRRLQDLQVTIEVRFITLNDNFFERIGVDFDFDINDNAPASAIPTGSTTPSVPLEDRKRHLGEDVTVGLQAPGLFSADMDIPFNQNTFTLATPQFGGFANGQGGAQLGFAILSDIEAFFFIEAAQGDRRSNVLQAPKVTLFNGQLATVSDISQSPFVISVIPVVGDFAAAQQPVIVVLSEGTFLTVQAVVSSDRRFVRLTVVPFFSNIGDVNTFTFTGSSTSTEDDSSEGKIGDTTGRTKKTTTSSEGTTVQLPTFSFVSVSTTVSVPDGGTVLLGGIKRLSEGRNEFGVPVLNKLPYINRLFRNVGIGRETQSLMMMVTPRIIIQEEEEFNLTGQQPTP
jgi:general secretion pathway protein D